MQSAGSQAAATCRDTPRFQFARRPALILFLGLLEVFAPSINRGAPIIEQQAIASRILTEREHRMLEDCVAEVVLSKRKIWMKAAEEEFADFARNEQLSKEKQTQLRAQVSIIMPRCLDTWKGEFRAVLEGLAKSWAEDIWSYAVYWIGQSDSIASLPLPKEITRPLDDPAWKKAIAELLSPEQAGRWREFHADVRDKKMKAIAASLQAERETKLLLGAKSLVPLVSETKCVLQLTADRSSQVERAAETAARLYADRWSERMTELLLGGDGEIDLEGAISWWDKDPFLNLCLPGVTYREAMLHLLTGEELQKLVQVRKEREERRAQVRGRQGIVALDVELALTKAQCQALEPLATRLAAANLEQDADLPQAEGPNSPELLAVNLGELALGELRAALDSAQLIRLESRLHPPNPPDLRVRLPTNRGSEAPDDEEAMEASLSAAGELFAARRRKEILNPLLLQVEDIARVSHPPEDEIRRLLLLAERRVAKELGGWRNGFFQRLRDSVDEYLPELPDDEITPMIWMQMASSVYSSAAGLDQPEEVAAWNEQLRSALSPDQWNRWRAREEDRTRYAQTIPPEMALAEFDALLHLSPAQVERVKPIIGKFVNDYAPELASYFTGFRGNPGWHLYTPPVFLPFVSAEAEVKAILSPEQWDYWSKEPHYASANAIFKDLRERHENRLHPPSP